MENFLNDLDLKIANDKNITSIIIASEVVSFFNQSNDFKIISNDSTRIGKYKNVWVIVDCYQPIKIVKFAYDVEFYKLKEFEKSLNKQIK